MASNLLVILSENLTAGQNAGSRCPSQLHIRVLTPKRLQQKADSMHCGRTAAPSPNWQFCSINRTNPTSTASWQYITIALLGETISFYRQNLMRQKQEEQTSVLKCSSIQDIYYCGPKLHLSPQKNSLRNVINSMDSSTRMLHLTDYLSEPNSQTATWVAEVSPLRGQRNSFPWQVFL